MNIFILVLISVLLTNRNLCNQSFIIVMLIIGLRNFNQGIMYFGVSLITGLYEAKSETSGLYTFQIEI